MAKDAAETVETLRFGETCAVESARALSLSHYLHLSHYLYSLSLSLTHTHTLPAFAAYLHSLSVYTDAAETVATCLVRTLSAVESALSHCLHSLPTCLHCLPTLTLETVERALSGPHALW
jgi:hypothetical protein